MKTYLKLLAFVALGIPSASADDIPKEDILPTMSLQFHSAIIMSESDEPAQGYPSAISPNNKMPRYVGGILIPNDHIAPSE